MAPDVTGVKGAGDALRLLVGTTEGAAVVVVVFEPAKHTSERLVSPEP